MRVASQLSWNVAGLWFAFLYLFRARNACPPRRSSPTCLGTVMLRCLVFACVSAVVAIQCAAAPPSGRSGPKPVAREFRGVWVATVENIDWPSKPGLPVDKQKQEFIAILDKCVELNINAVIFQIRTAGRCAVRFEARALVGISDGQDGEAAEAVLRSARVRGGGGASAGAAAARVV